MRIDFKIDTRGLNLKIPREEKRLAFNTALALNETAKAVQLEERANLDRKFTIRKATFMYRLIKIFTFASARAGRAFAEIGIDRKERVLLSQFEEGGVKKPAKGKSVGVPVTGGAARPSFQQSVIPTLQIGKLRFRRHRTTSGALQWKGLLRTFIIPLGNFRSLKFHPRALGPEGGKFAEMQRRRAKKKEQIPGPGILQRTAEGLKRIYLFIPRPKLQAMLGFVERARETAAREWPIQFKKAYRK